MASAHTSNPTVVRTTRGLTVGGTRLTIYQLMDHLKAGQPREVLEQWYNLTREQVSDILAYIDEHRETVEAEYQEVLRNAEANQKYWEERNRPRMEEIARRPLTPEQAAAKTKLDAIRERLRAK